MSGRQRGSDARLVGPECQNVGGAQVMQASRAWSSAEGAARFVTPAPLVGRLARHRLLSHRPAAQVRRRQVQRAGVSRC